MRTLHSRFGQGGSALVVTLAILVALTLIGIGAISISKSNFRLATNLQFQNAAQNEAESALASAESWISTNYSNAAFYGGTAIAGLYGVGAAVDPFALDWDDGDSVDTGGGTQRYVIELLMPNRTLAANSLSGCNIYNNPAPCPKVNVFRITARGQSRLGATKIIQTLFTARQNV